MFADWKNPCQLPAGKALRLNPGKCLLLNILNGAISGVSLPQRRHLVNTEGALHVGDMPLRQLGTGFPHAHASWSSPLGTVGAR